MSRAEPMDEVDDDTERPRDESDCACTIGGSDCPCEADGDDGYCSCCRGDGDHNGSCRA